MAKAKPTAIERLRKPQDVRIVNELPAGAQHWGPPGASMVISTPQEIEGYVKQIPKGSVVTLTQLREKIAARHGTTIACPVTTGLFLNIVARAAREMEALGINDTAPWWRVVKTDGSLNEKFPGGIEAQAQRLRAEGISVVAKGKKGLKVSSVKEH
jgi:alkylated DNA nucleotide flippase Atl1